MRNFSVLLVIAYIHGSWINETLLPKPALLHNTHQFKTTPYFRVPFTFQAARAPLNFTNHKSANLHPLIVIKGYIII